MYNPSQTLLTAMAAGNPQRVLLEFTQPGTSAVEAFSNEDIAVTEGIQLTSPFNGDEELTFGLCPSAQIQFSLLNDMRQIDDFTFGECKVWIGFRIDEGTPSETAKTAYFMEDGDDRLYEFIPIGVFITERPDVVRKDIISVTANDRMSLFDVDMPSKETLQLNPTTANPVTLLQLLQAMCTHVGVTLATTAFLNYDLQFSAWPGNDFANRTMRDVLRWIAEAAGSIARFNRDGELEIAWFTEIPAATLTYDEHDYSEFTQTWYETAEIDGLRVRNQAETSETVYGTDPSNAYIIAGNPFLR